MSTSLFAYIKTLKSRPLLSRSEEADLLKRAQAGQAMQADRRPAGDLSFEQAIRSGKAAEAILAESFLHKIVQEAKSLNERSGERCAVEDLVAAGNEGLLKGVRRFDLSKDTRFWTYAFWWVKDAMTKELRSWRWPFAISDDAYRNALKIMRISRKFWQETGDPPSDEDLAAALGWDVERLRATLHDLSLNDLLSIEKPMGDAGMVTLADFLIDGRGMYGSDPHLVGPEEDSVGSDASILILRDVVRSAVEVLSAREQEVLKHRFGLEGAFPGTFSFVGEKLGVSGERARQIQESALAHLRSGPLAASLERFVR